MHPLIHPLPLTHIPSFTPSPIPTLSQVNIWRRSYDVPPPEVDTSSPHWPGNDPMYANVPEAKLIKTESLKVTLDRVLPYWTSDIAPTIKSGDESNLLLFM